MEKYSDITPTLARGEPVESTGYNEKDEKNLSRDSDDVVITSAEEAHAEA